MENGTTYSLFYFERLATLDDCKLILSSFHTFSHLCDESDSTEDCSTRDHELLRDMSSNRKTCECSIFYLAVLTAAVVYRPLFPIHCTHICWGIALQTFTCTSSNLLAWSDGMIGVGSEINETNRYLIALRSVPHLHNSSSGCCVRE
jgi:hypothetical protein